MNVKAVIFDMDGVLLDSEPLHLMQIKDVSTSFGKTLDDEYLYSLVGRSFHDTWDETARRLGGNVSLSQYQERLKDFPISSEMYKQALFPGVIELLQWLKQKGYALALASSSTMQTIEKVLKACDIYEYFDVYSSGEMFLRSKPDPQIYIETLSQLGLSAHDCVIIEDSRAGIEAAKRAGVCVIARRDERFGVDAKKANYQVNHTYEIRELLIQMKKEAMNED